MLVYTLVKDWRIDSGTRVNSHLCPAGNKYLLNNRGMFEMHDISSGSWMYYFDNPLDVKCSGAYLRSVNSVELLVERADYAPLHENAVVLPVFEDNDITKDVTNRYVPMFTISRAFPYDITDSTGPYTWVVYILDGWDIQKVLCSGTFDAFVAYVGATD